LKEYEQLIIYNDISGIKKDKIEEFKKSNKWKELDTPFDNIISGINLVKSLIEIIEAGEISKIKWEYKFSEFKDYLPMDFALIPLYLRTNKEKAIEIITKSFSNEDDLKKDAEEQINILLSDFELDDYIKFLQSDGEKRTGAWYRLINKGEIALPKIKLTIHDLIDSQKDYDEDFMSYLTSIIVYIELEYEDAKNLLDRATSDVSTVNAHAQKEINKLINNIDIDEYIRIRTRLYPGLDLYLSDYETDRQINNLNEFTIKEKMNPFAIVAIVTIGKPALPKLKMAFFDEKWDVNTYSSISYIILTIFLDSPKKALKINESLYGPKGKEKQESKEIFHSILGDIDLTEFFQRHPEEYEKWRQKF
jgi:hypothetical protein